MLGAACNPCCEKCTCTTIESLSVAVHWNISRMTGFRLIESGVNPAYILPTGYNAGQPRYPIGVIHPFTQISPTGTAYNVPRVQASEIAARFGLLFEDRTVGVCYYLYEDTFGGVTVESEYFGTQALGVLIYMRVAYSQYITNQVIISTFVRFAGLMIANTNAQGLGIAPPNGDPYVDGFRWDATSSHTQGCLLTSTFIPYPGGNSRTLTPEYGEGSLPTWPAGATITAVRNPLP